jgi:uncharacterized protein involved in tellurium resistance
VPLSPVHYLCAQPRSEDLLTQANGLRRDVEKLVLSYVFEGVFQGHLAQWREVEGVVGAKTPSPDYSRSRISLMNKGKAISSVSS